MSETDELLEKLDKVAPIHKFDAFPKVQGTYSAKTTGGGLWTLLVLLGSLLLVMNDLSEYVWGWPDFEFDVDAKLATTMKVNVDVIVNMPCHYLSVDLRDAVGDRLMLSDAFKLEGTTFDQSAVPVFRDWQHKQSQVNAQDMVALSKKSRGLFSWLSWSSDKSKFAPTYNYRIDRRACRVFGSVEVKKVTANLHITTAGHGYGSMEHTDHSKMNLSHIITEFSFGPHFPDIVQPLDYTVEITPLPFTVFQYFINVVPTTYYATPSRSVKTNQYSVTHYTKEIEHNQGAPGLFFKFDIDPMTVAVHQRTTTFFQFITRVIGVVGGVWVCARWAFKIGGKAVEQVVGKSWEDEQSLVRDAHSTGRKSRWTGGSLNKRVRHGSGWDDASIGVIPASPGSGFYSPATPPYSPALATPGSMHSRSPSFQQQVPQSPYAPPASPYSPGHGRSASYAPGMTSPPPLPSSPSPSYGQGSPYLSPPPPGSPGAPPSPKSNGLASPPPPRARPTSMLNPNTNRVSMSPSLNGSQESFSNSKKSD